MRRRLREFLGIVSATLREIFDESAYARFLAHTGVPSVPSENSPCSPPLQTLCPLR